MKLIFDRTEKYQPDPFIFEDEGKFYIYVTNNGEPNGVEAYSADSLLGPYRYEGAVTAFKDATDYWAPAVIKIDGVYYMYVSCVKGDKFEHMHVAKAESPLGPFTDEKMLYDRFSIDAHMVKTEAGLFLFYAENNTDCANGRIGTRVFVDRFLDPYTPANEPRELITPDFDEEIFTPSYREDNPWHTVEGPFYFREGEYQYLMYSGGCFQDETYHVGYAVAKSDEEDLTKVNFVKHTNGDRFAPVLIKNEYEEGTGHHSVIKHEGKYYAIYHARDYMYRENGLIEARDARICRLHVADGIITAERYKDKI
ncbi:MAG: hypothetical protein E7657_00590 [Ruminococcaceae bacterium]|nr:hypothetical protein [Oscillospiraceae bacterium]